MYDVKKIKQDFPIFKHHSELHYLDSGATSQTPQVVIDAMNDYYTKFRANTHRGLYTLSVQATQIYEAARASLASFIQAAPEEIIFTSGTTHGLNALAYLLCGRLTHRDNIVLTRMEHHANLVPWQQLAKHYGCELRFIDLDTTTYHLLPASYNHVIDANTKIVSLAYVSNVLGTVNPIEKIIKITRVKSPQAYTIIDAAQAAAHLPIDAKKIDCDFLVFSGHKMYGPTGLGVLYGKKVVLAEQIEPFCFGGNMVQEVSYNHATWNEIPWRFEAGTQNIAGAIGLSAAVKFIQSIGWKTIQQHEQILTNQLINQLTNNGLQIVGPQTTNNRIGVVSFVMPHVHPHDIAHILGNDNVAIRAGNHCARPLHTHIGIPTTIRASLGIYNTKDDIAALIKGIKKVKKVFG